MITQSNTLPNKTEVNEIKHKITNEQETCISEQALKLKQDQTLHTLKAIQDAKMPGASLRFGALPLAEFSFALNKSEFRDALSLRYGRPLKGLPAMCRCGQKYNVTHALNCKKGGFVTMRHNNLRDFEADMLSKILNCNRLPVKLLKDYPEMLQDPILEQEVCGEPARTLFLMLG